MLSVKEGVIQIYEPHYSARMNEGDARALFRGLQTIPLSDDPPALSAGSLNQNEKKVLINFMNDLGEKVG